MISSVHNEKIKEYIKLAGQKNILCLDSPKLIDEAIFSGYKVLALLKQEKITKTYTQDDIVVSENVLAKF